MTGEALAAELPPRLLLLNGADGARTRSAAAFMQAQWPAVVFDAEALALLIERGLPARSTDDTHRLVACRHAGVQVGATLAHLFKPLVVVPGTLTRRYDVAELARGMHTRRVQFAHVVVTVADCELPDEDAVRAARALDVMPADARLDATGLDAGDIAGDLVGVLVRLGWLRPNRYWTSQAPRADLVEETRSAPATDPEQPDG